LPYEPEQITPRYAEEKKEIEGVYLNIAFHSSSLLNKDLYAMDILSFILGQGEGSRLNKKMRLENNILLSVSAYNYTPKEPGLFIISSILEEKNINDAIDGILKEIELIKQNGVDEKELQRAKNNFIADYIYQKETIESQANDLALGVILTGDPLFFEKYIQNIKDVSVDDVQDVARRYLKKDNMTITLITRSGDALKARHFETLQQKSERKVSRILLENGLTILVDENHALPTVSIYVAAKGGLRFENAENNGISNLLSSMFIDGTTSMKREELTDFYESRGIELNPFSGNNSVGFSIRCLKENLEDVVKLVSDICQNLSFPIEEFDREKKEIIANIEMQDNEIFNHGHRLLKELLFKNHPYRFQTIGTKDSVTNITRESLFDFYRNVISGDNMVIGVSGDVTTDEINLLAERYLKSIPAKKILYDLPQKENPIDKIRELYIKTQHQQSLIILGFHGVDIFDKKRYALEVLVELICGESGGLMKKIRNKIAASYTVGGFQVTGIDPGYIVIYALTSSKDLKNAKEAIFKEISNFIKAAPKDEEIEKAKSHLKANWQMSMQTNLNFISTVSIDELYGLTYNNYKNYPVYIDSVTKEDLKKAALEFLTLDRCAIVIMEGL